MNRKNHHFRVLVEVEILQSDIRPHTNSLQAGTNLQVVGVVDLVTDFPLLWEYYESSTAYGIEVNPHLSAAETNSANKTEHYHNQN